ncbi:MAG: hypothetical protein RMJ56_09010 [Gemmataceae bacterium]|nr:hypothetical protein [Gemmata sp.]MDW8197726.1 hypothetical protein [Gemmataceae bacterium]
MEFNLKRVAEYIRRADTEELLDRVTIYRAGMEPAALDLMEGELDRRGLSRADIRAHEAHRRATAIFLPDGTALRCSFCDRPAVQQARGWHKLHLRAPFISRSLHIALPLFPRLFAYCAVHLEQPASPPPPPHEAP